MNIVLLGAGRTATQLGLALKAKQFPIVQVYSRTEAAAQALATPLQAAFTSRLSEIVPTADLYLFAVKDSALPAVLAALPANEGLWVHTAGSLPMTIFQGYTTRCGVLYPLQTMDKNRHTDFGHLPLFIEAACPSDAQLLEKIARTLSDTVVPLSSDKRKYLHLAAVFACNFSNHLYGIASEILEEQAIDRRLLLPLIEETAAKIRTLTPREAQTGPAVRYDTAVIDAQIELLHGHPHRQMLYRMLSEDIHRTAESNQ